MEKKKRKKQIKPYNPLTRRRFGQSTKGIYAILKYNAKQRKKEFLIPKEDFIKWYEGQVKNCHYCDRTPKELNLSRLTIDRMNNDIGYYLTNVVLACRRCNQTKSDFFTYQEMLKIGEIIKSRYQ